MEQPTLILAEECTMLPFTKDIMNSCTPFSCGQGEMEQGLNDFFINDSFLYKEELLGKTYCWITKDTPHRIVGLFTISNDSIKTTHLGRSTTNRLNRGISNPKRGRSYPAVLKWDK